MIQEIVVGSFVLDDLSKIREMDSQITRWIEESRLDTATQGVVTRVEYHDAFNVQETSHSLRQIFPLVRTVTIYIQSETEKAHKDKLPLKLEPEGIYQPEYRLPSPEGG